jgi:hypothetical protein
VFEANMAAEQAMKDAIEADTDAQCFEDLARSYERIYKAALTELEQVKAACAALENQLATTASAPDDGSAVDAAQHAVPGPAPAPRSANKRRAFTAKQSAETTIATTEAPVVDAAVAAVVECEPVVAAVTVVEVKRTDNAGKPLVVIPPPPQSSIFTSCVLPPVATPAPKAVSEVGILNALTSNTSSRRF